MPNTVAYLALLLWPLVVILMFRRMPIERALIWSILGGYLFLPPVARFDFPMVPALDKVSIPNLSTLFVIAVMLRERVELIPRTRAVQALLLLFLFGPLITVLNNREPILFGQIVTEWSVTRYPGATVQDALQGLRIYDAAAFIGNQLIYILPFFLARQFLASAAALREVLIALVIAGLIYSVPMLIEARLSPQLNTWIYGFFQHSFAQTIRWGGFRPIVFLQHGLWLAFFTLMCVVAAATLARAAAPERRPRMILATIYLLVMLVVCRSMGPLVHAAALLPLVLLASPRVQLRVAALLAMVTVAYPLLRGAGLVPVDTLLGLAEAFSEERAGSLRFRFDNEAMLLAHASEKPLFGWGGWGRNMVHDMISGEMLTIVDGRWIIVIGTHGWLGYIAEFGLLALPVLMLAHAAARLPASEVSPYGAAIALLVGANMIDLLPNATLIPFTWLMAGAVLGHAERLRATGTAEPEPVPNRVPDRASRPRTVL